ncbi:MAG: hypothetical protein AB7G47_09335 [Mycolicibacterium sp.]|uniref:hypothetical protein n=1 Tax=Mycolicibacterium sp. TaxID=2320850 RepID=UPI003D106188
MTRLGLVPAIAAAALFAGASGVTPVRAQPPPPCSFTLSPPRVVQISGVDMVAATVAPDVCGPPAAPAQSVACLQIQTGDRVVRCFPSDASGSAQALLAPYVPGATYIATGRGCSTWIGQLPAPECQLLGPNSATL